MAKVLIADDDVDYLSVFQNGLELLGHAVTACHSADEVRGVLGQGDFDIVFVDVVMPGGGAVTLVHEIFADFPKLPIVVISGQSALFDTPLLRDGLRMARAVLRKTASLQDIDGTIRKYVKQSDEQISQN